MHQIARSPDQVGHILQQIRKLKGMTQTELAERAGLRQEMISKIESGHAGSKISTICDLLAALDLELTIIPRSKGSSEDLADIF